MMNELETRRTIAFLNWAHAVDHYVVLIFATAVISLEVFYQRPYSELIELSWPWFVAFGVFALPAGWLADHWSRRNMMAIFYAGCGLSLVACALAPNPTALKVALFFLGFFAAIYHPVGIAMLIEASKLRGRTLAFNGVCGNLGAALASGITGAIAYWLGWQAAFLIPAALCLITAPLFFWTVPDDRHHAAKRESKPSVRLTPAMAVAIFGCFILIAMTAGLIFNAVTVALPKIVEERVGQDISLYWVGSLATAVFMAGALAQLAVGRLVEKMAPHLLLVIVVSIGLAGTVCATTAEGLVLLIALSLVMVSIYGQVTLNDMVIARYTADAWRGRVYAVRFFLLFVSSGVAVKMIAHFHEHGGFQLLLTVTAAVTAVFLLAVIGVAIIASLAPSQQPMPQPAE